ncbi:MAG TPA: MFS transporter [Candidatus Limnocylindria bacterium]|jgi:MFS family permease|nr:MFS transporter [Candidatus Limnocylindria bacterium]
MKPAATLPGATPAARGYAWGVVGMLWFVCAFNYADRQAISVVFPLLKQEFGFDKEQLGLIGSAFMWVYAAGAPLAGWAGDRFPRRHLILGGCLFWSFVTLTTAWCGRLWQFVTVRALEGFGETFYFPASMSLVSAYHGLRTRSRAMALHQSSVYAGTIGGSWLGAVLAERYGWRTGFYCFGAAGMVLAGVLYVFLREPDRELTRAEPPVAAPGGDKAVGDAAPPKFKDTLLFLLRHPSARLLLLAFVGANFVAALFLVWTPTFLIEKFGFKLGAAGLSATVFIHAASALSGPLSGWAADAWSVRRPGARMLVQAVGMLVGAGFVALVGWTQDKLTLLLAMTAFGLCKGCYDAGIFASLYDVVPANARATTAGVMNTVGWTGGALGPLYAGWMAKHAGQGSEVANMSLAVSLCGLIYLGVAALLWRASRRQNR